MLPAHVPAPAEALVRVHVRRHEHGELPDAGELTGEKVPAELGLPLERVAAVLPEARVDVARVADPAMVGLGHERDRAAVLLGDLLRPVLVDDVMVARRHRVGVAKRELVLARPGLGLGRLDRDAGRLHALAELADERLVEAGSEQVRVGHVPGGGAQLRVPVRMRLCVALAQEEELELRADLGLEAGRSGPLDLLRQDPSRRLLDGPSVEPARVAEHERRRLVPGNASQRGEIRAQQEVAVARARCSRSRSRASCPTPYRA